VLNYGIIGFGYWGPNLVRSFSQSPKSRVVAIADSDPARLAQAQFSCPAADLVADPQALISRRDIDVVAIATPISTHYPFAKAALAAGKHVFVEKPLTARSIEAQDLINDASRLGLQIFVDHTFIYSGAVRKIKQFIERGDLGKLLYYDSVRINLGMFQHDVNVIWDLAVHDVAILDYIVPDKPIAVSATALDPIGHQPASIAYLMLFYPTGLLAHIHASWLAPVKIRQTIIGGERKMILFNDLEPSEKVRIYDKGLEFAKSTEEEYHLRVGYRAGDMLAPQIDSAEPLAVAAAHANECFMTGKTPLTSGSVGHRVVSILEAAQESAQEKGRMISLDLGR